MDFAFSYAFWASNTQRDSCRSALTTTITGTLSTDEGRSGNL
jgi:hypothetical protein